MSMEALAKVLNNNVAANFSLRVLFYFNTLQTQAKACGYQNSKSPYGIILYNRIRDELRRA